MKKIIGLISLALFFSSCVTIGTLYKHEKISTFTPGETPMGQVRYDVGMLPKYTFDSIVNETEYIKDAFIYATGSLIKVQMKSLFCEYKGGTLNGYQFISNFKKSETNYNYHNRVKIEKGVTDKEALIEILGYPHGIILMPSVYFEFEDIPENTSEIYYYASFDADGLSTLTSRELIAFINEEGVVIDFSFEGKVESM